MNNKLVFIQNCFYFKTKKNDLLTFFNKSFFSNCCLLLRLVFFVSLLLRVVVQVALQERLSLLRMVP